MRNGRRQMPLASLEQSAHRNRDPIWSGQLVTVKILGTDRHYFPIDFRNCPHPSSCRKFSNSAFHELDMRKSHVPSEFDNAPILDDDQECLPVGEFDWLCFPHEKSSCILRLPVCRVEVGGHVLTVKPARR